MDESYLTLVIAAIAVLGIGAQWLAWWLQLPAIVLLCVFGILAGPVTGLVVPGRDLEGLVHPIVRLCVAVILFEGGLSLRWHEFREAAVGVRRLLFPALPLNWLLGSLAAHYVGGLSWSVALVFGAIIVVTGPTVIMPLLRQVGLRRRPASYLKWEGIINDPVGALLAVLVFQFFVSIGTGNAWTEVVAGLLLGTVVAGLLGYAGARWVAQALIRGWIPEFLKPAVLIMVVIVVYEVANAVQAEAGLLAATVMGVVLGNRGLADIHEIRRFKEYLAVLLVSTVFILLTADLDPAALARLDWRLFALLGAIIFVIRPVAVLLSTIGSPMTWQERALVAWIAPRGIVAAAVAGVFGHEMVIAGYEEAGVLVPLTFALILSTVVLHGFSLRTLALRLGLASQERRGLMIVGASPWSIELAQTLKELGVYVLVCDASWHRLREARLAGLPHYFGEVLSEEAEEQLDLADIGYLLAATDNDAYNALVCSHFVRSLGREYVFQLPKDTEDNPRQIQRTITGRTLYGAEARYETLVEHHYRGWRFQKTRITASFPARRYFQQLGLETMPLLAVKADGALSLRPSGRDLNPAPGDLVVAYMSPAAQAMRKKDAGKAGEARPGAEPGSSARKEGEGEA